MYRKVKHSGCEFRPHFKTHQSLTIGNWFREEGVSGITVSSTEMALYFSEDGWDDITIAFPFYPGMLTQLQLLEKSTKLRLFINNEADLEHLNRDLINNFKVYIEIDTGSGRSGIPFSDKTKIGSLIKKISRSGKAHFHGFYVHDGRTYAARGSDAISPIIKPSIDALLELKGEYPDAKISIGDTPTASVLNKFEGIDELTPGNFVFYDWTQVQIGSCSINEVALFVQLPVAQPIQGSKAIVHGGAVHLSKDTIQIDGKQTYGQAVDFSENEIRVIEGSYLSALSQEHGTLSSCRLTDSEQFVTICPVHSCLTANLFECYYDLNGTRIEKRILS
jgi:D-serine deaminase-like pyridoxal phosphate-dependent protein